MFRRRLAHNETERASRRGVKGEAKRRSLILSASIRVIVFLCLSARNGGQGKMFGSRRRHDAMCHAGFTPSGSTTLKATRLWRHPRSGSPISKLPPTHTPRIPSTSLLITTELSRVASCQKVSYRSQGPGLRYILLKPLVCIAT